MGSPAEGQLAGGMRLLADLQRGNPASGKVPATWSVHHTDGSGTVTLCRRALRGTPSPTSPGDWERMLKELISAGLVEENTTRLGKRVTREPVTKKKVASANYDTPEERIEISDLEDEDGEIGVKTPPRPAKTSKTGTSTSSQAQSQSS